MKQNGFDSMAARITFVLGLIFAFILYILGSVILTSIYGEISNFVLQETGVAGPPLVGLFVLLCDVSDLKG